LAKDKTNGVANEHPAGCLCDDCKAKERAASGEPEPEYVFNPADWSEEEKAKLGGSSDGEYTQTKRKGRPKASKQAKKESISAMAEILIKSHWMLAQLLDTEELLLNEKEGNNLASAIDRVQALYPEKTILNEELTAWLNLGMEVSVIYGTRYIAMKARKAKEKRGESSAPIDVDARTIPTGAVQ
jgi:hypothetical protein